MKRIILLSILILFLFSFKGCFEKEELNTTLTPARNIEGIWVTTFPVKFYIATEDRVINWEIEWVDDNTVFITMNFTTSNFQIANENCNLTGYVPDITLDFFMV